MRRFSTVLFIVSLALCPVLAEDEVDFYLDMQTCKNTAGFLVLSTVEESIKILDGTPYNLACVRRTNKVFCSMEMDSGEDGVKGNEDELRVILDSAPLLYLESEHGADYYAIHTVNHAAVVITRMLGDQFAGECRSNPCCQYYPGAKGNKIRPQNLFWGLLLVDCKRFVRDLP